MQRLTAYIILLLSSVLLLAACGSDNTQENQSTLEKVESTGQWLIGTEGQYPPFSFHDDTGTLTGFDIDVATEVAIRLGFTPVFVEAQWDALFAGLDSGRFDTIANQVGINPERTQRYDFSLPYISSSAVLVVNRNNQEITSINDIEGRRLAQSLTSNLADLAREHGADIVGVEGLAQAIQLLQSGRVEATINDRLSIFDYIHQTGNENLKIIETFEDQVDIALIFRQDSPDLVAAVNSALEEMIADNTLSEIVEHWFGHVSIIGN